MKLFLERGGKFDIEVRGLSQDFRKMFLHEYLSAEFHNRRTLDAPSSSNYLLTFFFFFF